MVVTTTKVFVYFLNATSGAAESSPGVVKPDTNAGTKRWILKKAIMDYADITGNDAATDVTGAELEELTDASETTLHSHAAGGTDADYSDISTNDGATDVTGAELEELTNVSETTLHSHAAAGGTFVDRGNTAAADFAKDDGLTVDGGFHDLDLSSIIPEGAKAVLLRIHYQSNATGHYCMIKEKGNANDINVSWMLTQVAGLWMRGDGVVACDGDRKVEYAITGTGVDFTVGGWWT